MIDLKLNEDEKHGDMNSVSRLAALNRFRNTSSLRQTAKKVLVIYDIQLKSNEVPHVPLVINYGKYFQKDHGPDAHMLMYYLADLPKAVEEYSHRSVIFTT
jgi:translation initiation factor 4A